MYRIVILVFFCCSELGSQEIHLKNPSFEGKPEKGMLNKDWADVGFVNYPTYSPPDVHGTETDFWDNPKRDAAHGKTYLGLMVREDGSNEGLSQRLSSPLLVAESYLAKLSLAKSSRILSPSVYSNELSNYNKPAILRIIGYDQDYKPYLLACSPPITHEEWQEYTFVLEPEVEILTIGIEAFFTTKTLFEYNGNLLVDNITPISRIKLAEKNDLRANSDNADCPSKLKYVDFYAGDGLVKDCKTLKTFYIMANDRGLYDHLDKRGDNYLSQIIDLHRLYNLSDNYLKTVQKLINEKVSEKIRDQVNASTYWQQELFSFLESQIKLKYKNPILMDAQGYQF